MNYFGPQGPRAASQPSGQEMNVRYGSGDTWVKDCTTAVSNDGTILNAAFFNNIIGNLNQLVVESGISDPQVGDMTMVFRAVQLLASGAISGYVTEAEFETVVAGLVTKLGLQAALNGFAPLFSPNFGGNPTAPTPNAGDNSGSIATTAFVAKALLSVARTDAENVWSAPQVFGSYVYTLANEAGVYPNVGGGAWGWNFQAGNAEVDHWNTFTTSVPTVSHTWWQLTGAAAATRLADLSISGFSVLAATDSTSPTTGAITTAGGLGVAKNLSVGGTATATLGAFKSAVINANTSAAAPAALGGTMLQLTQADGLPNRVLLDSFGGAASFTMRYANGTNAVKMGVLSGQAMFTFAAFGYGTTGYSATGRAFFSASAAENWTDTAQGTYFSFSATPVGSVTSAEVMRVANTAVTVEVPLVNSTLTTAGVVTNDATGRFGTTPIASLIGGISSSSGFVNKIRNGTMDIWQRGPGPMNAPNNLMTADGWRAVAAGNSATVTKTGGRLLTTSSLNIAGSSGMTGAGILQRIESSVAAPLAGQTVTFQAQVLNGSGVTIAPVLQIITISASDNWASAQTVVAAPSLQPCPNGVWTQVAYTFAMPAVAVHGVQVFLSLGALTAAQSVSITEVDMRVTPGVVGGLNAAPPTPELRPVAIEMAFCQRYYSTGGALFSGSVSSGSSYFAMMALPAVPRATPTFFVQTIAISCFPTGSGNITPLDVPGATGGNGQFFFEGRIANLSADGSFSTFWQASSEL